jgi:hypothetical protein
MGTLNYLVNHEKKQIFSLGKGIDAPTVATLTSEQQVSHYILCCFVNGFYECEDKPAWAERITTDIKNTLGFTGNWGTRDSDASLFEVCAAYTVVGSIYEPDEDIGKLFYPRGIKQ